MKLKNKLLLAVGLAWLFFLVITYWSSQVLLRQSFLNLEYKNNEQDLLRVDAALDQQAYSLETLTAGWSQGNTAAFLKNDISANSLFNSQIQLALIYDNNNQINWGTLVDFHTKTLKALPENLSLNHYFSGNSPMLNVKNPKALSGGFILLGNTIYLVASRAITDANNQSVMGVLLVGRELNQNLIYTLEHVVKLNLKLITLTDLTNNKNLQQIFNQTVMKKGHQQITANELNYQTYTLIKDVFDHPIGMIQISGVRLGYLSGLETTYYWLVSFIIFGLIISFFLMFLIRVLIIEPIENLNDQVDKIGQENELKRRIQMRGNDELSSVADKINSLLTIIQGTQEELEERVDQRTKELKDINQHLSDEIAQRKSVEEELIQNKEHLLQLSHYDELTTLPNRVFFNEILNKSLKHTRENKKLSAILAIDLDRFKNINETMGRQTGDLVIKEVAFRFSTLLRPGDVLARLGGDEFIILLNNVADTAFVDALAEKILAQCSKPIKINVNDVFITGSIGICLIPADGDTLELLEGNVDVAMYKAKQNGGNNFQYFAKEMHYMSNENIELEIALRKAINNKEFVLNFQPKINLANGNIVGVEALLRWYSPELGSVNPSQFIPVAEKNNMILEIEEWVLRQACFINKNWQTQGYDPIPISVNVSEKQFRHPNFVTQLKTILSETKLDPRYLELELAETTVKDNTEGAVKRLHEIKDLGISFALDDFGMGYTSINLIKRFAIDALKIDQRFIKGLPKNTNDIAVVRGVIALAHSLELKVVAEGVETVEQVEFLSAQHCDYIQGYYISRPLSERKIILMFAKADSKQAL